MQGIGRGQAGYRSAEQQTGKDLLLGKRRIAREGDGRRLRVAGDRDVDIGAVARSLGEDVEPRIDRIADDRATRPEIGVAEFGRSNLLRRGYRFRDEGIPGGSKLRFSALGRLATLEANERIVERRRVQGEFVARGLRSRDEARRTGDYVDADVVLDGLQRKLDAARVRLATKGK